MNLRVILKKPFASRATLLLTLIVTLVFASSRLQADTGTCGGVTTTLPFTDVQGNFFFCSIASAFFSGLTNGTTATTYSPSAPVPREQMAAFVSRTLDQSLRRGSQRAAMKKFWIGAAGSFAISIVGDNPRSCECDGADVWVTNSTSGTVSRVRASDGALLQTWTGATNAFGVVTVNDDIYVTGNLNPGRIYKIISSSSSGGAVSVLSSTVGSAPDGIAFDGNRLWTANGAASVSRVTPGSGITTTFSTGFVNPRGILFDGTNIWVTDDGDETLKKLDGDGNILQTISVGNDPRYPVYDGTNIWVPSPSANNITVVRASTGQVLATISTAGIVDSPVSAAFDGEKIFVTSITGAGAFYKATDLSLLKIIGAIVSGDPGFGTCSDGTKFFFTVPNQDRLVGF